jgi:hypothetical protein
MSFKFAQQVTAGLSIASFRPYTLTLAHPAPPQVAAVASALYDECEDARVERAVRDLCRAMQQESLHVAITATRDRPTRPGVHAQLHPRAPAQ